MAEAKEPPRDSATSKADARALLEEAEAEAAEAEALAAAARARARAARLRREALDEARKEAEAKAAEEKASEERAAEEKAAEEAPDTDGPKADDDVADTDEATDADVAETVKKKSPTKPRRRGTGNRAGPQPAALANAAAVRDVESGRHPAHLRLRRGQRIHDVEPP